MKNTKKYKKMVNKTKQIKKNYTNMMKWATEKKERKTWQFHCCNSIDSKYLYFAFRYSSHSGAWSVLAPVLFVCFFAICLLFAQYYLTFSSHLFIGSSQQIISSCCCYCCPNKRFLSNEQHKIYRERERAKKRILNYGPNFSSISIGMRNRNRRAPTNWPAKNKTDSALLFDSCCKFRCFNRKIRISSFNYSICS